MNLIKIKFTRNNFKKQFKVIKRLLFI